MDLGTVLGILGCSFSSIAIIIAILTYIIGITKTIRRTETRLELFMEDANRIHEENSEIIKILQVLRSTTSQSRPDLSTFLINQWRFLEKLFRYRFEKHSVAKKIAEDYIKDNYTILLDSGSTTDLVTSELLGKNRKGVTVYSNNVFAAIHLAGARGVPFILFHGSFDDRYAAVYSNSAIQVIEQICPNLFILAAVVLRSDKGIMVHCQDEDNYSFKAAALKQFMKSADSKLIIAADSSKFFEPIENHKGVLEEKDWADLIDSRAKDIVVVTSRPAREFSDEEKQQVNEEIEKFSSKNIKVEVCLEQLEQ